MAAGGFFRFLVSGTLFLTATTTTMQRAHAASSTDDASDCVDEANACFVDNEICYSCVVDYDSKDYEECLSASWDAHTFSSYSSSCVWSASLTPCCVDEASEHACMNNDAYVEYWECLIVASGCLDGLSCIGYNSSESASSGVVSSEGVSSEGVSSESVSSGDASSEDLSSEDVSKSRATSTGKLSIVNFSCVLGLVGILGLVA